MKQLSNQVRLAMAQDSNPKITVDDNSTIYTVGNVMVNENGELEFGSDEQLWQAYRLAN